MDQKKLDQQSQHWENEFSSKPEMFGLTPSLSAEKALKIFQDRKISKIIELGAGLGRDSVLFAKNSIQTLAMDYSKSGIEIINQKAKKNNLSEFLSTKIFDIRKKLPFADNSIEGFYSHMLYCMALTTIDLKKLNSEIFRVLKPEDLYENDGFIVHYFSKEKVNSLLGGFKNITLDKFEEGKFPRRLFFVVNEKII